MFQVCLHGVLGRLETVLIPVAIYIVEADVQHRREMCDAQRADNKRGKGCGVACLVQVDVVDEGSNDVDLCHCVVVDVSSSC